MLSQSVIFPNLNCSRWIGKIPDPLQCDYNQDKLFTVEEELDLNFTFL